MHCMNSGLPITLRIQPCGRLFILNFQKVCPRIKRVSASEKMVPRLFRNREIYKIWSLFKFFLNEKRLFNKISCGKPFFIKLFSPSTMAASEYWTKSVLQSSDSMSDVGGLNWDLALYLLLVWIACFFILSKGVKSSGKAVYVTALVPYVTIILLLIRGVTLPGAAEGISYYLTPNMTKLESPEVWKDAGTQVMFSYALCLGALVAMRSETKS